MVFSKCLSFLMHTTYPLEIHACFKAMQIPWICIHTSKLLSVVIPTVHILCHFWGEMNYYQIELDAYIIDLGFLLCTMGTSETNSFILSNYLAWLILKIEDLTARGERFRLHFDVVSADWSTLPPDGAVHQHKAARWTCRETARLLLIQVRVKSRWKQKYVFIICET